MDFIKITTPLDFPVSCTEKYWQFISSVKHPSIKDKIDDIIVTISNPVEIRRSKRDDSVLLFYKEYGKYLLCAVVKKLHGRRFLITAYLTDKVKEGERIWKR